MLKNGFNNNLFFSEKINDKSVFIISILLLMIFALPLFILGGDSPYDSWDNLDSNVVWRKVLIDNHLLFAGNYETVEQFMNVPRFSLGNELNLFILLDIIFGSAMSLAANRFLQIIVGFIGMYVLCRKYILKDQFGIIPSALVAILFSILPFWSSGSLSIAAQPLVLFSFLRMRDNKSKPIDWIIMVLYPFCSSFIVYGFFFYILLFGIFCYDFFKKRNINWKMFLALAIMSILSLVTEWRTIFSFFISSDYISHRVEFGKYEGGLKGFFLILKEYCFYGQPHSYGVPVLILFLAIILILYSFIKKNKINLKLKLLLLLFFMIAFISSIQDYYVVRRALNNILPFSKEFDFTRFYTLLPVITYLILAFIFKIVGKLKFGAIIIFGIFSIQALIILSKDYTYKNLIGNSFGIFPHKTFSLNDIKFPPSKASSFNDFYSEDLFDCIKYKIDKPLNSYKVASVGLHPAVSQYNGLYTVDGFSVNYPLEYKHLFRQIIEKELDSYESNKFFFDNWGSWCYIFTKKLDQNGDISSLDLNYDILKSLNCQYIISTYKIVNPGVHLNLIDEFENSTYKIYLYKII